MRAVGERTNFMDYMRRFSVDRFMLVRVVKPSILSRHIECSPVTLLIAAGALAMVVIMVVRRRQRSGVYMVDYACFRPPDGWRIPMASFLEHSALNGMSQINIRFQEKILQHSGLGQQTALPPSYRYVPSRIGMVYSRAEAETVFFSVLDSLFRRSGVQPQDIDVLVLNCCLFYPAPSLSAMLVNRYKMRSDIKTFNLSGMGCAASLLAIDMVSDILRMQRKRTYALVVSSENMSGRDYLGARRSMLIANCLFRTGGAAVLLCNGRPERGAKYELLHTERTITAADDTAFFCIMHGEDEDGAVGVALSKDLLTVAGDALKKNMTSLAPRVLPVSELLKYVMSVVARKVLIGPEHQMIKKVYMPDFKRAFEHFCIHAGGKAVIQELGRRLQLPPVLTEPSRMTLHRFGNTSSTSVWYELAYLEVMGRVKAGDRVWQVSLGSGFKCCSAVWRACSHHSAPFSTSSSSNPKLKTEDAAARLLDDDGNPWLDSKLDYPQFIPDSIQL